jgi:uncharacterized membrane protein (UPF0127 family)
LKTVPFSTAEFPEIKKARIARSFLERARGLIGTKDLPDDEGMIIERCNAIHTCFMGFPIDACFLDKSGNAVKTFRNIRPWRLFVWGGWRARKVLEVKSGTLD